MLNQKKIFIFPIIVASLFTQSSSIGMNEIVDSVLGLSSNVSGLVSPAFAGTSTNPSFKGSLMTLAAVYPKPGVGFSFLDLNLLSSSHPNEQNSKSTVFSIKSDGKLYTSGGITTTGRASMNGKLSINAGISLDRKTVRASNTIIVPNISSISLLEITKDNMEGRKEIMLQGDPSDGQVLLVKNNDGQDLTGSLGIVPRNSMLLYVYFKSDGWNVVTFTKKNDCSKVQSATELKIVDEGQTDNYTSKSFDIFMKSKSDSQNLGQLAFIGQQGVLLGSNDLLFDPTKRKLYAHSLDARHFTGNSINFSGATICNADLVNATIGALHHLTVGTLGIVSEQSIKSSGTRMAIIDERGLVSTAKQMKWDEKNEILKLPGISSLSNSGLKIQSHLDLTSHTLRNFELEPNSTFRKLRFEDSIISNSKLVNVTATDLILDSVKMESLTLSSLEKHSRGSLLAIGERGAVKVSTDIIRQDNVLKFQIPIHFEKSVHDIFVESMTLLPVQRNKRHASDSIVFVNQNGKITSGNITVDSDGWLEYMKVSGSISFRKYQDSNIDRMSQGKLLNPLIEGGSANDLEELSVVGKTRLNGGLDIQGEVFIHGSLTVSGSVLGSGPYVDISDSNMKTNIESISKDGLLNKLFKLDAVSYELKENIFGKKAPNSRIQIDGPERQIGLLAQNVEKYFPELVHKQGSILGVQYSRFVPLLIEGMKLMQLRIENLEIQRNKLQTTLDSVFIRLENLERSMTKLRPSV